jgi:serine/threonine-protein kinase RsbW
MTSASEDGAPPATVEVRIPASPTLIPTVRVVASDLAARADFDLDAISDLRMAVDEACATLVGVATGESVLTCRLTLMSDRIDVEVTVSGAPGAQLSDVPTNTFGWRVLQTLADEVRVVQRTDDEGADLVGIRLGKRPSTDAR